MRLKRVPFEITRQGSMVKPLKTGSHAAERVPDFMDQRRRVGPHRAERQAVNSRNHPRYPAIARQVCNGGGGSSVMPANDTRHRQVRHGRSQMVERFHLHPDKTKVTSNAHHFQNGINAPVNTDGDVQVELSVEPFKLAIEPVMSLKIFLPEPSFLIRPRRRLRSRQHPIAPCFEVKRMLARRRADHAMSPAPCPFTYRCPAPTSGTGPNIQARMRAANERQDHPCRITL